MSIKKEMLHGVFWISIAKYSGFAVSLIISAILARLLEPDEFGVIAIAAVLINFLSMFSDMGIGAAVVQSNQLEREDYDNLFMFTVYMGFALAIISFLSSWWFAAFYQNTQLIGVVQLLSLTLLFNCLNTLPNAQMTKGKKFKTIAIRGLFFQLIGGGVGVVMAFHGYGVYSLVFSSLLATIGTFVYNFICYPHHLMFVVEVKTIKKIFSFSVYQFLFGFLNYFSRNLDKIIIGKYLNMNALGYYEKSYRLMNLPLDNITYVITPVILPILSSLRNNVGELANKQEKLISIISMISFPIGVLLHFTAFEIIRIYYGDKWVDASPVFSILALSIPLQMILSTIGSFYQCTGKTKHMFFNGLLNTSFTVSGFIWAVIYWKTIEAVAWAWVITLTVNFINSYFILYRCTLRTSIVPLFYSLRKSFFNAIILFSIMQLLNFTIGSMAVWPSLLIKLVVWGGCTLIVVHLSKQFDLISFYCLIQEKLKKNSAFR